MLLSLPCSMGERRSTGKGLLREHWEKGGLDVDLRWTLGGDEVELDFSG